MNAVEGFESALRLAQANLDETIKNNTKDLPQKSGQNPTTYSPVYLRVQPFLSPQFSIRPTESSSGSTQPQQHLQFLLYLSDPTHGLAHSTVSQTIPENWLDLLDDNEWAEELIVDSLRVGVEVLGQEYVVARMGWGTKANKGKEKAQDTLDEKQAIVDSENKSR